MYCFVSGLHFFQSNLAAATDDKQYSPTGYNIILPSMVEYAKTLDLNLPIEPLNLDTLIQKRELELKRYKVCTIIYLFLMNKNL